MIKDRLGVPQLSTFLSKILLEHLRQHMPTILSEVCMSQSIHSW